MRVEGGMGERDSEYIAGNMHEGESKGKEGIEERSRVSVRLRG